MAYKGGQVCCIAKLSSHWCSIRSSVQPSSTQPSFALLGAAVASLGLEGRRERQAQGLCIF